MGWKTLSTSSSVHVTAVTSIQIWTTRQRSCLWLVCFQHLSRIAHSKYFGSPLFFGEQHDISALGMYQANDSGGAHGNVEGFQGVLMSSVLTKYASLL